MKNLASQLSRHHKAILGLIFKTPGISRPQLAQETGLAPSAVHGLTLDLERLRLIAPDGVQASSGGRKATRYLVPRDMGYAIGVSMRIHRLDLGIFDAHLNPILQRSQELDIASLGPESYTEGILKGVEGLIAASGLPRESFLGVCVSVPGPTDRRSGVVLEIAAAPLWQQFPLAQRLQDLLELPVRVEKDVFCAARYLHLTGKMKPDGCSAYLCICEGISAALFAGGDVFPGSHSLAGEIGHLTVRKDGVPCTCGNIGCLELYCSDIGILRQYNVLSGGSARQVEEVIALAERDDPVARKVFAQAVAYLVETTSAIIMNYDPDDLLIYCTWLSRLRTLYFRMLDALYQKSVFTRKHTVNIQLLPTEPINLRASAAQVFVDLIG